MTATKLLVSVFLSSLSCASLAGSMYSGADKDLETAFNKALVRAKTESRGGCLCKRWDEDISALCKKDDKLGVFVCQACGSNHKGSCDDRSQEQRALDSVKRLFR